MIKVNMFLIFFVFLFFVEDAFAYLDPGTGSMILQMLIGGIAAAIFTVKLYWFRIKEFFSNFGKASETEADGSDEQ